MENIYLLSFDSNCGKGGILKELERSFWKENSTSLPN